MSEAKKGQRSDLAVALASMAPGPGLSALIEEALRDPPRLTDAELAAIIRATGRLIVHARSMRLAVVSDQARAA